MLVKWLFSYDACVPQQWQPPVKRVIQQYNTQLAIVQTPSTEFCTVQEWAIPHVPTFVVGCDIQLGTDLTLLTMP